MKASEVRSHKKNVHRCHRGGARRRRKNNVLLPPDDASPQQNGVDATKQKPLLDRTEVSDYLKRELKVDVNGCAIGYFLDDKNVIGSGGSVVEILQGMRGNGGY